ncbi:unnamed protein product, partial [Ectocarpus sp. 12 AP-2014]
MKLDVRLRLQRQAAISQPLLFFSKHSRVKSSTHLLPPHTFFFLTEHGLTVCRCTFSELLRVQVLQGETGHTSTTCSLLPRETRCAPIHSLYERVVVFIVF